MAHLKGLRALEFLAINRTRVSDAGLDTLRGLSNLKEIWVANSAVSDEGAMRSRQRCPTLIRFGRPCSHLRENRTALTPAGIHRRDPGSGRV